MLHIGIPVVAFWFIVDQATKWWIVSDVMNPPSVIPITGFFNIVLGYNTGVSFGLLSGAPVWSLFAIGFAAVIFMLIWMARADDWIIGIALGLIIGGASGNLVDRYRQGAVTDFLDFHIGQWHWPTFNMADVGIVFGVGILLFDAMRSTRRTEAPKA